MANLSNINNKFLVTTGGNVLIGQTAVVGSSIFQVTGVSTFAGSVNITGGTTSGLNITTSGTQDTININRAANNDNAITKYQTASTDKWIVGLRNTADDNFRFYNYGTSSDVLILDTSGNATFSGSITAAGINPTSLTTPLIQLQGDLDILNKAQTSYIDFATRDTSGSEVVYNLSNVGSATFFKPITIEGTVAGSNFPIYKTKISAPFTGGWNTLAPGTVIGGLQQTNVRSDGGANNIVAAVDFQLENNTYGTGQTNISFKCGGVNGVDSTERMRIKADGNILVANTRQIQFYNTTQYIYANSVNDLTLASADDINIRANFSRFFNGSTEFARLSGSTNSWIANGSNSKLGIARTDPSYTLDVNGNIGASSDIKITTSGRFLQGVRNTGSVTIDMIGFINGTDTVQIKGGTSGATNAINFYDTGGLIGTWYNSNFGIGITNPQDKLHVNGDAIISSTRHGDFSVGSLNTTGYAIANVAASTNGSSAIVEFVASGGSGAYYNVVYSCYNGGGAWYYTKNVVGSGGNIEVAETNGSGSSALVFWFRSTSGSAAYTPRVMMKASPYNLVTL